jgi:hypothetical protein
MGAGRSGTTLLDIMLGNQENVFSGGELNRFTFRRGIPTEFPPESNRYQFWQRIKEALSTTYDLAEYDKLQDKFEYHWGTVKRLLNILSEKEYRRYQRFMKDYYTLIFNGIEEDILVDSSKFPGRALSTSETFPDHEVSYIYIRRDPVAVIDSFAKKDVCHPSKDWLPANSYYFAVNILCRKTLDKLSKRHKCVSIRYEDLVLNPIDTLDRIQQGIDLDLSMVKNKIRADAELDVGNLFEGNRIRIPHKIKLKRAKPEYPPTYKNQITHLMNGWLYQ